jgi:hypothetical protein
MRPRDLQTRGKESFDHIASRRLGIALFAEKTIKGQREVPESVRHIRYLSPSEKVPDRE